MSEMETIIAALQVALRGRDATLTAVAAGNAVRQAMEFLYRAAREPLPEDRSILSLMGGRAVNRFVREHLLEDKLRLLRILAGNAQHGLRVKRTQAEVAAATAYDFLSLVRAKAEPGAPAFVFSRTMSEAETRREYIDLLLGESGWEVAEEENVVTPGRAGVEIKVTGMPPHGQDGYCDYVLYGLDGKPLAVVEAKKTSRSPEEGHAQALIYAERLAAANGGVRPVVYCTNGYEIYCEDGLYPERRVHAFHSRTELEYLIQRRGRQDIVNMTPPAAIADRPYQIRAIRSLCEHFNARRRKGLLIMATGTGKTRVSAALVKVLSDAGWVKSVLFLADRRELVKQAKEAFKKYLPEMSICHLSDRYEDGSEKTARLVFSTYQTMIHFIDGAEKKLGSGRFELVIVDEAHRSIFNKYSAIFAYFDTLLVGLTATPREEVDRSTYDMFGCEQGVPNFAYAIEEGVRDGYLRPWKLRNKTTAVIRDGIRRDDLASADRAHYDSRFAEADYDEPPEEVESSEIFKLVYNEVTCDRMIETLMREGQRVESGEKLGKTIIFAMNHRHAVMIRDRFNALYPEMGPGYCELIDNQVERSGALIDEFRDKQTMRIAVSVDMLDTGVDVPEVLNLVFAKRVLSKIKFFQMLGRGTRLCPNVFGAGRDKKHFLVFDYFGNFERHQLGGHEVDEGKVSLSVSQRIFSQRLKLMFALQDVENMRIPERAELWRQLRHAVMAQVAAARSHISRMAVKQALPTLDKYRQESDWALLSDVKVKELDRVVTPLVEELAKEHENIKLFDLTMLRAELAFAKGLKADAVKAEVQSVRKTAKELLGLGGIPEVMAAAAELRQAAGTEFWEREATLEKVEEMRVRLRELTKYIEPKKVREVGLHIPDEEIELGGVGGLLDIRTYREKVVDYLERNGSDPVVTKLKNLDPLTLADFQKLERVLYAELGTKEEYEAMGYEGSLVGFVRSCLTIGDSAVMDKFGEFLRDNALNSRQQEFVNEVVNYLRENGEITVADLVNEDPFADVDLDTLFAGCQQKLTRLTNVIETMNRIVSIDGGANFPGEWREYAQAGG